MRYENKLSSEGSILPVLGMRVPLRDGNSDPIHPNFGSPSYLQLEPFKNGKTKRKKGQKPSKKGKNWNLATLSEIIAKLATLCQPSLFSRWDHQSSSPSVECSFSQWKVIVKCLSAMCYIFLIVHPSSV